MRIAFITVGDEKRLTGGYLYNARIQAGLCKEGIEVVEITPGGAAVTEQLEASKTLDAHLNPEDFDVLVVDALARVLVSDWLDSWRERTPVVAMVHELPSVAGAADPRPEEPLLNSDRLVVVSENGKEILEGRGVSTDRISVVPPGFDRLQDAGGGAANKPGENETRVLCVAQWIERKGILELVRAWNRKQRPQATLQLIGENDIDPAYSAAVWKEIWVFPENRISVGGPLDDAALSAAYSRADLFALPSKYEGYGMVYAEAMAYGLPIVACDVGPVPHLTGGAASLVPPGDLGALSETLDLLFEDPDLRSRMSQAATRRAGDLPRWSDTVENFRRVLHGAVASRERTA